MKPERWIWILILGLGLFPGTAGAGREPPADSLGGPGGSHRAGGLDGASVKSGRNGPGPLAMRPGGWFLLPLMSHDSESGYGFGARALRPFRSPGCAPLCPDSEVALKGQWTTGGQKEAEAVLEWNLGAGRHYLKAKISYSDLRRRYYGLGPSTLAASQEVLRPEAALGYVELFRRFTGRFKAGLRYEYEQVHYLELERSSLVVSESASSASGGRVSGGGLIVDLDTRDRRHSPESGLHYQAFGLIFDDAFGSRFDFNNYNVDLANYFRLGDGRVLAVQAFLYDVRGGAPLWRLAELGGRSHTRGYRRGRYTDRLLLAFQSELRIDVRDRWGMAVFAGAGDVAGNFDRLRIRYVRPTAGAGFRFRLSEDHLKVRFDAAFGQESPRFHLALDEAF